MSAVNEVQASRLSDVDELRLQLANAEDALSAVADAVEGLSKRTARRLHREQPYLTVTWLRRQVVGAHIVLMHTAPPRPRAVRDA
jgi:hypothetical protein